MSSLVINGSAVRFIRAGRSNMAWPIFAILVFMATKAMDLPDPARIIVDAFLAITMFIGLRMYLATVARLMFFDDHLQILLAISDREIPYNSIKSVEVVRLRLTPLLRVRIKAKISSDSLQFVIPGPFTPWGNLDESSSRLVEEFRKKGTAVTAR